MVSNHFPSVFELVKNDSLLHQMYFKQDRDYIEKLFLSYSYGPVNKFPAVKCAGVSIHDKISIVYFLVVAWVALFVHAEKNTLFKEKEVCAELQDSLVPEITA